MLTVLEIVRKTADFFGGKGIESPRLNAELLVGHALGLPRMQLYLQFERSLSNAEVEKIRSLVRRRGQREPLQHLIGCVEFFGLKLKVDRRALIPRPETEFLVETIVGRRADSPPKSVLDLGTGTGAIALALAMKWPAAAVTAIDSSEEALGLARENAVAAGLDGRVSFFKSDWFGAIPPGARFDLAVANPPYLSQSELASSAMEVRDHEPASALVSGEDGIGDIRAILRGAPGHLAPGGLLALETGADQHALIRGIAAEYGWSGTESIRDLSGRDRYVLAWLNPGVNPG
ncbi:MAG: peptide chain release factor N(5)-glutamine methyltransferase [Opitutaceae bacterium]